MYSGDLETLELPNIIMTLVLIIIHRNVATAINLIVTHIPRETEEQREILHSFTILCHTISALLCQNDFDIPGLVYIVQPRTPILVRRRKNP